MGLPQTTAPGVSSENDEEITSQTILDALELFGWSYGRLGRELRHYRREGPYQGCSYCRQTVFNYAHPKGGWPISQPFAQAMRRLLSGNGYLRDACLDFPDLREYEDIPHGMSVRGHKRRCACGCGQILFSSSHWYVNDAHRRAARNKRRRNGGSR